MIPLDPEEIFGGAIWEACKRAFSLISCLAIGTLFGLFSAIAAETLLSFTPLVGSSHFIPPSKGAGMLSIFLWLFDTPFSLVIFANTFVAFFYYLRCEDPLPSRFLIFAGIQLISFTAACNQWAFDPSHRWQSIASSAVLWFFACSFLALLFFSKIFWKNKQRCGHEEHLMGVAAENEAWRRKLENAEFIPPPPSGPPPPKVGSISSKKRTTSHSHPQKKDSKRT